MGKVIIGPGLKRHFCSAAEHYWPKHAPKRIEHIWGGRWTWLCLLMGDTTYENIYAFIHATKQCYGVDINKDQTQSIYCRLTVRKQTYIFFFPHILFLACSSYTSWSILSSIPLQHHFNPDWLGLWPYFCGFPVPSSRNSAIISHLPIQALPTFSILCPPAGHWRLLTPFLNNYQH